MEGNLYSNLWLLYVLAFFKMAYLDVVIQFLCKTFNNLCWMWPDITQNKKFRHGLSVNLIGDYFQNLSGTNSVLFASIIWRIHKTTIACIREEGS